MSVEKQENKIQNKKIKNEAEQEEVSRLKQERRYRSIKLSIESGVFTKLEDIFSIIPPTNIGKDIAINFQGFKNRIAYPGNFSITELIRLADLIDIHVIELVKLILNEIDYKHS